MQSRLLLGIWALSSILLLLGLFRPIVEISVSLEDVLKDASRKHPAVGFMLQERGVNMAELASKLPPSNTTRQSIVSSVKELFRLGSYSAALIVLVFSVVLPITKQVVFVLSLLGGSDSRRVLPWVATVHKWAMVDVFVLAMVVLTLSSATAWNAKLLGGFYWFLGYFFLAAFLAKKIQNARTENQPIVTNTA